MEEGPSSARIDRHAPSRFKMPKEPVVSFSKSRPKGAVRFPPHEDLDEMALREVQKFRVSPFGRIRECCAHIPYNSGKKDFFEKTGRESFEGTACLDPLSLCVDNSEEFQFLTNSVVGFKFSSMSLGSLGKKQSIPSCGITTLV
jgi:hypothetical protein